MNNTESIQTYLENVRKAQTEEAKKQLFFQLLTLLYQKDETALLAITEMAKGAEARISKIELPTRTKTGFADTQSRNLIIEFEKDLKKTLEHAKEQLKEYVSGNWNSGKQYNFTLIATDCSRWVVLGVAPESYLDKTVVTPADIVLTPVEDFQLSEENIDKFFFFLDFHLFRSEPQIPTLETVERDFGSRSVLFLNVWGGMKAFFATIEDDTDIQTAYQEWEKFLSIAYGKFNANYDIFLIHSYLNVFAKLLGYTFVAKGLHIDVLDLKAILNGDKFTFLNIDNFVENDFYQWVAKDKYLPHLQKYFYQIAYKINEYDFSNVQSDILKGVYQGLIDLETKHALGEYYTPDWLCNRVVNHFEFERNAHILDPSCGSGSFLMAAIQRLIELYPDIEAEELTEQVVGIDIHPLSVQIAKTTLLAALAPKLIHQRKSLQLRVYLANSILTREDNVTLFGEQYRITIDKQHYMFSKALFHHSAQLFDFGVKVAENFANLSLHQALVKPDKLVAMIAKNYPEVPTDLLGEFYTIYQAFKAAKEQDRNGIWKFILQNNYKPYFLKQHFDYVVGNPPWFTYNSITNTEYQQALKRLADQYQVTPISKKNMPHLEIAAIFMAHSLNYLLKDGGKLAFVLPRSFLQAEQHHNTRTAIAQGFALTGVWDLQKVQNLFNVPACVLFAEAKHPSSLIPAEGIAGRSFAGKPPLHNATWVQTAAKVHYTDNRWFIAKLNKNTALTTHKMSNTGQKNAYRTRFQQGATIVPRNFYFVKVKDHTYDWHDRHIDAISHPDNQKDGKAPWKSIILRGRIESHYLFRTLLAKNILPFGYLFPPIVALPIEIVQDTNTDISQTNVPLKPLKKYIRLADDTFDYYALIWFDKAEKAWEANKTENSKNITYLQWLNWQNKLTDQNLNAPFLVVYTASAKDANACVLKREDFDLEFIVESAKFVAYFNNIHEAYYVAAFLNSQYANLRIKDFQATGLFGPRHVQKKILDVPLPKYHASEPLHIRLSELGQTCTTLTAAWLKSQALVESDYNIGRLRIESKKQIAAELKEIDEVLKEMLE